MTKIIISHPLNVSPVLKIDWARKKEVMEVDLLLPVFLNRNKWLKIVCQVTFDRVSDLPSGHSRFRLELRSLLPLRCFRGSVQVLAWGRCSNEVFRSIIHSHKAEQHMLGKALLRSSQGSSSSVIWKKNVQCFWKPARAMINNPLVLIVPIQQLPETHFSPRTSLSCKHFPLLSLIHDINQLFKHTQSSAFYQTFRNINIFKAGSRLCATVTITFLGCKGIQRDKNHWRQKFSCLSFAGEWITHSD